MRVKMNAWLSDYGVTALARGTAPEDVTVHILEPSCNMATEGWLLLGEVWVTPPPFPSREDAANLGIAALQVKLQKLRADAELAQNAILAEISKLQSLTYEEPQP